MGLPLPIDPAQCQKSLGLLQSMQVEAAFPHTMFLNIQDGCTLPLGLLLLLPTLGQEGSYSTISCLLTDLLDL